MIVGQRSTSGGGGTELNLNFHLHLYRPYHGSGIRGDTAWEHTQIYDALVRADAQASGDAMTRHIERAHTRLSLPSPPCPAAPARDSSPGA